MVREESESLDGLTVVNSPTVGGGHIAIAHAQQCLRLVASNSASARWELLGLSSLRAIFLPPAHHQLMGKGGPWVLSRWGVTHWGVGRRMHCSGDGVP